MFRAKTAWLTFMVWILPVTKCAPWSKNGRWEEHAWCCSVHGQRYHDLMSGRSVFIWGLDFFVYISFQVCDIFLLLSVDFSTWATAVVVVFTQLSPNSFCDPMDYSWKSSCPWDFPGKNIEMGSRFFLQGILPTRDATCVSCTAGGFFTSKPPRKPLNWVQDLILDYPQSFFCCMN